LQARNVHNFSGINTDGYNKRYKGKFKNELLDRNIFTTRRDTQALTECHCMYYGAKWLDSGFEQSSERQNTLPTPSRIA